MFVLDGEGGVRRGGFARFDGAGVGADVHHPFGGDGAGHEELEHAAFGFAVVGQCFEEFFQVLEQFVGGGFFRLFRLGFLFFMLGG